MLEDFTSLVLQYIHKYLMGHYIVFIATVLITIIIIIICLIMSVVAVRCQLEYLCCYWYLVILLKSLHWVVPSGVIPSASSQFAQFYVGTPDCNDEDDIDNDPTRPTSKHSLTHSLTHSLYLCTQNRSLHWELWVNRVARVLHLGILRDTLMCWLPTALSWHLTCRQTCLQKITCSCCYLMKMVLDKHVQS